VTDGGAGSAGGAFRLDGKVAIVTGAASGIGLAIARRFTEYGAQVHLLDVDESGVLAAAQRIRDDGGVAQGYRCDVTRQAAVHATVDEIGRTGRITTLVNNAGIAHIGKLETTSEADFERVFRVNVQGFYNCMLAVVPHLRRNGGGVILNLASIAASTGLADRFAYSMSKGAVVAMTLSVAKDYIADGVRCNCISPARVHTPFVDGFLRAHYPDREREMFERLSQAQPVGRMGRPEEIASLAQFLCSDEASFITGVDYPIDGGFVNLR
jgi:2-keto-3-deoxy-L-fuconate dehydrogenase